MPATVGATRAGVSLGHWWLAVLVLAALALGACGDDESDATTMVRRRDPNASAVAAAGTTTVAVNAIGGIENDDFVESEMHRDPFREYTSLFDPKPLSAPQRTVLMPNTSIEEMRLIAVITGVPRPRAMLVDRLGVGYTVEPGDYLGRPEALQGGGGTESLTVTLNWRVDRILANELVLKRDNPMAPNRPAMTRVIPLHPESGASSPRLTR